MISDLQNLLHFALGISQCAPFPTLNVETALLRLVCYSENLIFNSNAVHTQIASSPKVADPSHIDIKKIENDTTHNQVSG